MDVSWRFILKSQGGGIATNKQDLPNSRRSGGIQSPTSHIPPPSQRYTVYFTAVADFQRVADTEGTFSSCFVNNASFPLSTCFLDKRETDINSGVMITTWCLRMRFYLLKSFNQINWFDSEEGHDCEWPRSNRPYEQFGGCISDVTGISGVTKNGNDFGTSILTPIIYW